MDNVPAFMAGLRAAFLAGGAAELLGAAIAILWLRADSLNRWNRQAVRAEAGQQSRGGQARLRRTSPAASSPAVTTAAEAGSGTGLAAMAVSVKSENEVCVQPKKPVHPV